MKTKTQKNIISIFVVLVLVVGCFAAMPLTRAVAQTIYLKGSGSDFTEQWADEFYMADDVGDYPNVWHLVYTGNVDDVQEMQITFTNGEVFNWTPDMGFSTNGGGNNPGWVIVAPYDWEIKYVNSGNNNESPSFLVTDDTSNVNFNISGFKKGAPNDEVEVKLTDVIITATRINTQGEGNIRKGTVKITEIFSDGSSRFATKDFERSGNGLLDVVFGETALTQDYTVNIHAQGDWVRVEAIFLSEFGLRESGINYYRNDNPHAVPRQNDPF